MRAAGRPGRGERGKVAARVREIIAGSEEADLPAARADGGSDTAGAPWLPGGDFERQVSRGAVMPTVASRFRWDPGRRGLAAIGAVVLIAVVATGWWLFSSRPQELPVTTTGAAATGASAAPTPTSGTPAASAAPSAVAGPSSTGSAAVGSSAAAAPLVVDVAGKVRRPGIYQLAPGSRVYDAVQAAGGPRPGVSTLSLNLAEPLRDGEQVVVGAPAPMGGGAPVRAATTGAPSDAGSSATGPVSLNLATLEQLEALPGVGPVLAQNILDWRNAHGRFASVDQLGDVDGIGDKRLAQLRPLVSV